MNSILIIVLFFIVAILFWALFGGKEEKVISLSSRDEQKEKTSAEVLRRRSADKEIEEKFPEEVTEHRRRASDSIPAEKRPDTHERFKIPFTADEIIPPASRFKFFKRTLLNSEIYGSKGEISTAISLYDGVYSRINDATVRYKIKANIDYLKNIKKKKEEELKKRAGGDLEQHEQIKVKIDGNVPSTINIGVMDPFQTLDHDKIIEQITSKLKNDIDLLKKQKQPIPETEKRPDIEEPDYEIPLLKPRLEPAYDEPRPRVERDLKAEDKDLTRANETDFLKNLNRLISEKSPETEKFKAETPLPQHRPAPIQDERKTSQDIENRVPYIHRPERSPSAIPMSQAVPQSEREPVQPEARFDVPADFENLMDKLAKTNVPEPSKIQGDGRYPDERPQPSEQVIKHRPDDEFNDNDFELMSKMGLDAEPDNKLSDEEIFDKILKEDKKDEDQSFEIIGEKKAETDDYYDLTNKDADTRRKEDQVFYKSLIRSEKRLKKELPILKVSYDFSRLPEELSLSKDKNIIEYSFYKYKPMLQKADEYVKKRKLKDAMNYYKVILNQNIPPEFKAMIRRNVSDLTEYLEKYLSGD